jgi:hypothetical protein
MSGCGQNYVQGDIEPVEYTTGNMSCGLVSLEFNFTKQVITFTNGNDVAAKVRVLTQDDGVLVDNTNLAQNSDPIERNANAEPFSIGDLINVDIEYGLDDVFWNAIAEFWGIETAGQAPDTSYQGFLAEGEIQANTLYDMRKFAIPLPLTKKLNSAIPMNLVSCTFLGQMDVEDVTKQKNVTLQCDNNSSEDQRIQLYELTWINDEYVANGSAIADMMIIPQVGERADVKAMAVNLSEDVVYGVKIKKERLLWSNDPSFAIFRINLVDQYSEEIEINDVDFDF